MKRTVLVDEGDSMCREYFRYVYSCYSRVELTFEVFNIIAQCTTNGYLPSTNINKVQVRDIVMGRLKISQKSYYRCFERLTAMGLIENIPGSGIRMCEMAQVDWSGDKMEGFEVVYKEGE